MDSALFNELLTSVKEAGKIMRGEMKLAKVYEFEDPDVKAIREQIGLSQSKFAALIGVSLRTLQNWELGYRHPTGPAKVLLRLVQADPEAVFKNLHIKNNV